MFNTIEIILKILFLILSFIWAGKIMILRSDKQIVINPLLISISAILALLPDTLYGIDLQFVNIALYFIYILIILFGLYCMKRKNGVF